MIVINMTKCCYCLRTTVPLYRKYKASFKGNINVEAVPIAHNLNLVLNERMCARFKQLRIMRNSDFAPENLQQ